MVFVLIHEENTKGDLSCSILSMKKCWKNYTCKKQDIRNIVKLQSKDKI